MAERVFTEHASEVGLPVTPFEIIRETVDLIEAQAAFICLARVAVDKARGFGKSSPETVEFMRTISTATHTIVDKISDAVDAMQEVVMLAGDDLKRHEGVAVNDALAHSAQRMAEVSERHAAMVDEFAGRMTVLQAKMRMEEGDE